jgi:hypothetical protein
MDGTKVLTVSTSLYPGIFYIENNQEKYIEGEVSELNIKRIKKEFKMH